MPGTYVDRSTRAQRLAGVGGRITIGSLPSKPLTNSMSTHDSETRTASPPRNPRCGCRGTQSRCRC